MNLQPDVSPDLFTFNSECYLIALSNSLIANVSPGTLTEVLCFNNGSQVTSGAPELEATTCDFVSGFLQCSYDGFATFLNCPSFDYPVGTRQLVIALPAAGGGPNGCTDAQLQGVFQ
jgi:hypothetical protein